MMEEVRKKKEEILLKDENLKKWETERENRLSKK